jgi:hypothetical protein
MIGGTKLLTERSTAMVHHFAKLVPSFSIIKNYASILIHKDTIIQMRLDRFEQHITFQYPPLANQIRNFVSM